MSGRDNKWMPAAYFSHQTRRPESRYLATMLEALAVLQTVNHYLLLLVWEVFYCVTDNKALCSLNTSHTSSNMTRRLALKIQPWDINCVYVQDKDNQMAEALSQQEWPDREDSPGAGGQTCEGSFT